MAILFADILGFTQICETATPDAVIALLRGFRARMERCVFARGGTIDKYVGDCVMVVFGMLEPQPDDAASAVACALDMVAAVEQWNAQRAAVGLAPIHIGIGIHCGSALVGDIGGDRQMEFTVIGDTVNVASRLEKITRDLDADIVVSDAVAQAVTAVGRDQLLHRFRRSEPQSLRGRTDPVVVWHRPRNQPAQAARPSG